MCLKLFTTTILLALTVCLLDPAIVRAQHNDDKIRPNPGALVNFRGYVGRTLRFEVTGNIQGGIWGSNPYTDDSNLATAAVHAGLLANGETGIIKVQVIPGEQAHTGSTRNGVTSGGFGAFPGSYRILPDEDLDGKPVVLRAGKLDGKVPAWFTEADLDRDGQISLYEWKERNGDLAEFRRRDLNRDGVITAEEAIRFETHAKKDGSAPANPGDRRTAMGGRRMNGGGQGLGGQGAGGGQQNPWTADNFFDKLSKGRQYFAISEAPAPLQTMLAEFAETNGVAGGIINKKQFREFWEQRIAEQLGQRN